MLRLLFLDMLRQLTYLFKRRSYLISLEELQFYVSKHNSLYAEIPVHIPLNCNTVKQKVQGYLVELHARNHVRFMRVTNFEVASFTVYKTGDSFCCLRQFGRLCLLQYRPTSSIFPRPQSRTFDSKTCIIMKYHHRL
jgi:hypothetical protein